MKKTKYLNQFILFLSIISGVLWLGAYTGRFITFYQIFDGTKYNINNSLININFVDIASIILPLISLSAFAFLSYIVFFLLYLLVSKPDFKNNGWLIIISALFLISVPFELFLVIKYDFLLIEKIFYQTGTSIQIQELFVNRVKTAGGYPFLMMLVFLTNIYLFLFKPLTKVNES